DQNRPKSTGGHRLAKRSKLKTDENENEAVEHEDKKVPHGTRLKPCGRRHGLAKMLPKMDASRDAREHGGGMRQLSQHPPDVRSQQRDRDLGKTILAGAQRPPREHGHPDPDDDTHHGSVDELEERLAKQESSADGRGDG